MNTLAHLCRCGARSLGGCRQILSRCVAWLCGPPANDLGEVACAVPPPPWVPIAIGEGASYVCPGGSVTLCIDVENGGYRPQLITLAVTGVDAEIAPGSLQLEPLQRGRAVVHLRVPSSANEGTVFEALIRVNGCRAHYARWTLRVATHGCGSCERLFVRDAPKLVHQWYDHFYCEHPCLGSQTSTLQEMHACEKKVPHG